MKKRIIIGIILNILIVLSLCNVVAFDGEVSNDIIMPTGFKLLNGQGSSRITAPSGYDIYYQTKKITKGEANNITDSVNSNTEEIMEKTEELNELNAFIEDINTKIQNGTATNEEREDAKLKASQGEKLIEQIEQLEQANRDIFFSSMNASSWTKATNGECNINFSGESGEIYFMLWVKIDNGTETAYSANIYSSTIKSQETGSTPTEGGDTGTGTATGDWANAKIEAEDTQSISNYKITISNVTPEDNKQYEYFIGGKNDEPNFSSDNKLGYDNTKGKFYTLGSVSQYLELGPDQYISVREFSSDGDTIVLNKAKIEKPEQPKYTDVFWNTALAHNTTRILFNIPWGKDTVRKVHLRIGHISDDDILKNIYNKKENSFENLLNYGKSANAIFDETLEAPNEDGIGGIDKKTALFDLSNIVHGEYYFVYAVVEDENGKYIKTEGVTLARASVYNGVQTMFFYGSGDFDWKTFENEPSELNGDGTTAPTTIPQTGIKSILLIMGITLVIGTGAYIKHKRTIIKQ